MKSGVKTEMEDRNGSLNSACYASVNGRCMQISHCLNVPERTTALTKNLL